MNLETRPLRKCLREPIPEIYQAAFYLDAAVSAHLAKRHSDADEMIRNADIPVIMEWSESLWGAGGPWTRPLPVETRAPFIEKNQRIKARMPSSGVLRTLLARDGFHCRFCGIPLIRAETRQLLCASYPDALRWGSRNTEQHAGFQAMWLQFDHILPHARGGDNDLSNVVVTCAPCNNGRSNLTLDEVGLMDPRGREPMLSSWDGLERIHAPQPD
jgi:hypothetical protein